MSSTSVPTSVLPSLVNLIFQLISIDVRSTDLQVRASLVTPI